MELSDPLMQITNENLEKYRSAGKIATSTVDFIVRESCVGVKLVELEKKGMDFITNELSKVYTKVTNKGLSFPICLSLNNLAGHYIPKKDEPTILNKGDLLKVELGCHIDGFPSFICYTTLIGYDVNNKLPKDDKRNRLLKATIELSRDVYNMMKIGTNNFDIVKTMENYATKYNCNIPLSDEDGLIPGTVSYEISRYISDGYTSDDSEFVHRFILSRVNPMFDFGMRSNDLEENEVYAMDILLSTGNSKLVRKGDTYIYKRNNELRVPLRLTSSKHSLQLFNNKPFPLSMIDCTVRDKFGLKECIEKKLLEQYPVVGDRSDEYVARIKFTVIVRDKQILICGKPATMELDKLE